MTIKYTENLNNLSMLQADSRRDRGDRIAYLIDLAIEKARSLDLTEGNIAELQRYYSKTIERKTAYHGISGKVFNGLPHNLSLVLTFSADCQYPIDFFLVNSDGYIVSYLNSFKNIEVSVNYLKSWNILDSINKAIARYTEHKAELDQLLSLNVVSKHFRHYKKQCLEILNQFN